MDDRFIIRVVLETIRKYGFLQGVWLGCGPSGELSTVARTLLIEVIGHVRLHAQPAELMATRRARHVVATAVLLNVGVAVGTRLGVLLHPLLVALLDLVVSHGRVLVARHIGVPLAPAVEAVRVLACRTHLHSRSRSTEA